MAISVVQRNSAGSTLNTAISLAFGSNVTSGNAIIAIAGTNDLGTPSDNRGNTYTLVYQTTTGNNNFKVYIAYNAAAGATTVQNGGHSGRAAFFIYEVAGLAASAAFDLGANNSPSSSTTDTTPAIVTTQANELLLGLFSYNGTTVITYGAGAGYSNLQAPTPQNSNYSAAEERIVSSTGSYTASVTQSVAGNGATTGVIVGFADTPVPIPGASLVAGSNFTVAGVLTWHAAASPVAGSNLTVAGGINFTGGSSIVAGANLFAAIIQVQIGSASLHAGSVLTARPADVWLGAAALAAGAIFGAAGQVQGVNDEKVYEYKVFDHATGNYLGSLPDVISDYDYTADINTPGNAIQIELGRTPDFLAGIAENLITQDTSENIDTEAAEDILVTSDSGAQVGAGTIVDLNLDIEVWVYYGYEDSLVDETGAAVVDENGVIVGAPDGAPKGLRLFTGYISSFDARYGTQETVIANCLPNGVELNQYPLLAGDLETVVVPFLSMDPSDIVRGGMDSYITQGGSMTYDDSSVANTITAVSYEFKLNTILEVIQKAQELAPTNWWWYGDPATNKVVFQPIPSDVTHTFTLGKHIKDLDIKKTIEGLVNDFYFLGGDMSDDPTAPVYLFRHYTDATSISTYRRGLQRQTDQRVTVPDSADIIANSAIDANKNPRYQATCVVLAEAYEIETIEMGQLVGFNNFGNYIDGLQLQIVGRHYQPDYVTLKLDSLLPQPSKRLEDIKRNLVQLQTLAVPDAPS